jgi:pescadillo
MGGSTAKKSATARKKGAAANYITRTQAVRKLQISLSSFRKLCIWCGIYPREPRDKKKVSKSATPSTTFYYTKDIQYLLRSPLINKFREYKVLEKKISRALGRGDLSDAKRYESVATRPDRTGKPRYTLDHVVRERYPTFDDALHDMDDCLSMLFLFASLPATESVPPKMIARCERLCLEFQHYLITSHNLDKSFLSIKGIYYQATIRGENILWLVPYKFTPRMADVDFRIMGNFVEFYMTLLGFVNFRLYKSEGLKYPPKFDESKDNEAGELGALSLERTSLVTNGDVPKLDNGSPATQGPDPAVQAEVNKLIRKLELERANAPDEGDETQNEVDKAVVAENAIDKFEPVLPGGEVLPQPAATANERGSLFAGCTFFLSRETPRAPLEFILRAFGCKKIGWDAVLGEGAFTTNELDPSITHQVIDRPIIRASVGESGDGEDNQTSQKLGTNARVAGRIYIQPQWVWDSINDMELKQPDLYAPGAELPPHLSPWAKPTPGQYDPTAPLEDQETQAEALADSEDEESGDEEDESAEDDLAVQAIEGLEENLDGDEEDDESEAVDMDDTFGGFSGGEGEESEEDEASVALQRQRELEAEMTGQPIQRKEAVDAKAKAKAEARKSLARQEKEKQEQLERARGMLSKKKRRLYDQMMARENKREAENEALRAKRRRLEKAKGKA